MYSTNLLCMVKRSDNSYLFVNCTQIVKFKAKNSEIVPNPLCLGNISKELSPSNATILYGYVYDFSVDYKAITNNKIHDIHRYLMKKTVLYEMFGVMKKIFVIVLISTINSLKCNLVKTQECNVREVIINNEHMLIHSVLK